MTFTRTSRYAINPDQISFIDFGKPGDKKVIIAMGTHALTFEGDDAKAIRDEFPEPAPVNEFPQPSQEKIAKADAKASVIAGGKQ